jgi:hypothetical protein
MPSARPSGGREGTQMSKLDETAVQHVRPSVLIRQWIEQQRDAAETPDAGDLAGRVERLERAVFRDTRAS